MRALFFGSFVNPNNAGLFLAVAAALALLLPLRAAIPLVLLFGGGVWWTGSRGAVLALLVALAYITWRRGSQWAQAGLVVFLGAVLIAVAVVGPPQAALWISQQIAPEDHFQDLTGDRLSIWQDSLQVIAGAPWLGTGLGAFEQAFRPFKQSPRFSAVDHAHQEILQILAEQGILGGLPWLMAAGALLLAALRRRDPAGICFTGAALAMFTYALAEFPLRIGALSVLAGTLAGAILADPQASPAQPATIARLRLASGLSLALSALLLALWWTGPDPQAQSDQGEALWMEHRDASGAQERYTRTLLQTPFAYRPLIGMGILASAQGDLQRAEAWLVLASRGYPALPWPWLHLARLRKKTGDTEGMAEAWRKMLALNVPDNDDATPYLKEALSTGADPALLLPDRADRLREAAHLLLESPPQAEPLFQRAVALDPRSAISYGSALLTWGRPEEAYQAVAGLPEEQCGPARVASKALLELQRYAEARARFAAALRSCPAKDQESLQRGLLRARLGLREPAAIAEVEALLQADPDQHALRRALLTAFPNNDRESREKRLEHLEVLILAGTATLEEMEAYSRLAAGLPP